MKKFMSAQSFNLDFGLLLIRLMFGASMAAAGYQKITKYSENLKDDFWINKVSFLGLSGAPVLNLVIFAEFFCSLLIMAGFLTRLALIPLVICSFYIFAVIGGEVYHIEDGGLWFNPGFPYFIVYIALFFTGAGKYSVDHLISKR